MWEDLVGKYETGAITSAEFRQAIRDFYLSSPSDELIDEAWNALLNDIPEERLQLLEEVRKSYRIFLLSNSNPIHYQHFARKFSDQTGYQDMDGLFEKAYFSFNMGLRKPDPQIFRLVLQNHGLIASETLFIDDTREHTLSAGKIGIVGFHLKEGMTIRDLFKNPSR
jgi:putative hydrolase of the HAD superfamily